MLDIEKKFETATRKIKTLRILHADDAMQAALDETKTLLEQVTDKASGLIRVQAAGSRVTQVASCLGLQLPIPDAGAVLEQFTSVIKGLAEAAFFDEWLDALDGLVSLPDLSKLASLKDLAENFFNSLGDLDGLFSDFSALQNDIKNALSTVSALVGCTDPLTGMGLGQHFQTIPDVLKAVNPDFKAGLDAVVDAKQYFSNPKDIFDDAKARVTGLLDLDGRTTRIDDQFQQVRKWLG